MKLYQKMKTTGGYRLSLKMSTGLVRGTLDMVGGSGAVRKFKTIKIFAKICENLKNFTKILKFHKNLNYLKYLKHRTTHHVFTDRPRMPRIISSYTTYGSIIYMYKHYTNPPVSRRIQYVRIQIVITITIYTCISYIRFRENSVRLFLRYAPYPYVYMHGYKIGTYLLNLYYTHSFFVTYGPYPYTYTHVRYC